MVPQILTNASRNCEKIGDKLFILANSFYFCKKAVKTNIFKPPSLQMLKTHRSSTEFGILMSTSVRLLRTTTGFSMIFIPKANVIISITSKIFSSFIFTISFHLNNYEKILHFSFPFRLQKERAEREKQEGQLADVLQRSLCPGASSSYIGQNSRWNTVVTTCSEN